MMNASVLSPAHILWAFGIGTVFVFWPVLGKYSQVSGAWVTTIVIVGSTIASIGFSYSSLNGPMPTLGASGILLIAGMMNGAAFYLHSIRVTDPRIPTGPYIMAVIITMVVMTPLFNYLLNGVMLSVKQWLGLGAAILSVILLAG